MPSNRYILTALSDKHAGYSAGLLNPNAVIYRTDAQGDVKEMNFEPTPGQKELWGWHEEDRENVSALAGKDPIVLLDIGDQTHGNRFTSELVTPTMAEQVQIATWNLRPWVSMKNVKDVFLAKGTGVHTWGEGSTEILVSEILKNAYPQKYFPVSNHYLINIHGLGVDVSHHGPKPSKRNWLQGNNLRLYLQSMLQDELDAGHEPARLILRGHYHTLEYAIAIHKMRNTFHRMEGWILPSYTLIGEHATKVGESPSASTVGLLAFEIINGKLVDAYPFVRTLDHRTKEVVL